MAKYIFNKDYETQVRVKGLDGKGTGTKQLKITKGTLVEGTEVAPDPSVRMIRPLIKINYQGNDITIDSSYLDYDIKNDDRGIVPPNLFKKDDNKNVVAPKSNKSSLRSGITSVFTTKNIVITAIIIGGVVYLKHKKII